MKARRLAVKLTRSLSVALAPRYHHGRGPTLVLAPHADDESIGCGGTIAAKRARDVRVVVAIATDGALSDAQGRPHEEVVAAREAEALAACAELGVPAADVRFLGLPDGALADHREELVTRVGLLAEELAPDEVFVSSDLDPHPDHQALSAAVGAADLGGALVREYLVWAWPSWPLSGRRVLASRGAVSARELLRLVRRGRRSPVGSFRSRKAAAISRYESQVGDGRPGRGVTPEMLAEFAGGTELFLVRAEPGARRSPFGRGSPLRRWLRLRAPRLRDALLAPRRALHRRRWARRHTELSREDRAVLTEQILPAVREEAAGVDVLFVGVDWYTAGYPALFPEGNLVTLDVSEAVARHGAARHLTADVRELGDHIEPGSLAAIVCNGVLGYGVDSPEDVSRALHGMSRCLRADGLLVVGWNDIDGRRVPQLQQLATGAGFAPSAGAGLSSPEIGPIGPLRHVYDVFRRSAGPAPGAGSA